MWLCSNRTLFATIVRIQLGSCSLLTPVWGSHLLGHKPKYGTWGTTLSNSSVQNVASCTSACSLNVLCYHTLCSVHYLWLYKEGRDFGLWLTCHVDLWFSSSKLLFQILISTVQGWDLLVGGDLGVVTRSHPLWMPILHACPRVNLLFTWLFWAGPVLSLAWCNADFGSRNLAQAGLANPVPESGSLSHWPPLRNICWVQRIQRGSLNFTQQEVYTERQMKLAVHRTVSACDSVLCESQVFLLEGRSFRAAQGHTAIDQVGSVPASLLFGGVAAGQMVDICELPNKQACCGSYGNFAFSRPFLSERRCSLRLG